uniref:Uncharacterized protein n=1 Tax=Lygus hesperus TaxID=30085 RepID=A0A0A9ZID9_LYGHE
MAKELNSSDDDNFLQIQLPHKGSKDNTDNLVNNNNNISNNKKRVARSLSVKEKNDDDSNDKTLRKDYLHLQEQQIRTITPPTNEDSRDTDFDKHREDENINHGESFESGKNYNTINDDTPGNPQLETSKPEMRNKRHQRVFTSPNTPNTRGKRNERGKLTYISKV